MPDPRNIPTNAAVTEPMSWRERRDAPGIAPPATVARQAGSTVPSRRTVDQGERTKRAPEGVWVVRPWGCSEAGASDVGYLAVESIPRGVKASVV